MDKNYTKISLKHLFAPVAMVLLALFSGCKGNTETQTNIGSFSVYNASPSFATYDVYLNGSKLNGAALPFGGGVKYTQLTQGTYEAKFTPAGYSDVIYTRSGISVGNNGFSTLYLLGTTGSFEGLLLTDDFGSPNIDKAYVRFINLSPDATALDLGIKDGSGLTSNKAYKAYSGFIAVDPGAKTFEVKENSSTNVKATADKTLVKGTFYTVIASGKVHPNNDQERNFTAQVITHQ